MTLRHLAVFCEYKTLFITMVLCALSLFSGIAYAQQIPGPADASRIKPELKISTPTTIPTPSVSPATPELTPPAGSGEIPLILKAVTVKGVTIFSGEDIRAIYASYLNNDGTRLASLWEIANTITALYRNEGYFLSRAYVPLQEIERGAATIEVVEGYVSNVITPNQKLVSQPLVKALIDDLVNQKPLRAQALESFILRLNDLPGKNFFGTLQSQANGNTDGTVSLVLTESDANAQASLSFDNYGSRFLGPYQGNLTYQDSIIPWQKTSLSFVSAIPTDELTYGAVSHSIPLNPYWTFFLSGSIIDASPGSSLSVNDIDINTINASVGFNYQPIRQRQENLLFSVLIDGKNTNGDILGNNPLTRDRIRTLRLSSQYDVVDKWNGYNVINLQLNQGLDIAGASQEGELNLSRADAAPDFTAISLEYSRQQPLDEEWTLIGQIAGQYAFDPLFSSEEFGYGGQQFGRAYDSSEITGEQGLAASVQLRYFGLDTILDTTLIPYGFYDIGKIWNRGAGGEDVSAASAGIGMNMRHDSGLFGDAGIAFPLTRQVDTPQSGDDNGPRLLFRAGYSF